MKKSFKLIALLLAIAMLAVSLCSCRDLDEAKENRAVYASADHNEIEYKGNTYRLLNLGKYKMLDFGQGGGFGNYISDKDVPVLLTEWYGEWSFINHDETYIMTSPYDSSDCYYVREDQYDAIKKAVATTKLDSYYLHYWADVDYDDLYWDEYENILVEDFHVVLLDDDAAKIVDNALDATIMDKISYKKLSSNYQKVIELGVCDSNKILNDLNIDYYFVKDKDDYYFWNEDDRTEYCLVPLNKKDSQIVSELFSKYPEAIDEEKVSWAYEYDYDMYDYDAVDTVPEEAAYI